MFYGCLGVAAVVGFINVWDVIGWMRVLLLVLLAVIGLVLQTRDWERIRRQRLERRRQRRAATAPGDAGPKSAPPADLSRRRPRAVDGSGGGGR